MISAKEVQQLRRVTGSGMMDAKRALEDAGGDAERAKELLRERGVAESKKRAGRAQTEGAIGQYLHHQAGRPVLGVLVELAAETDFVAKSDGFQDAARDIAMHVAAASPTWVTREEVPTEIIDKEKELIAAQARNEGKADKIIDRIVEGKLTSYFEENVLYDQAFINPDKYTGTVGDMVTQLSAAMGENIGVRRFVRMAVGEADGK